MSAPLRIVFAGTPAFAATHLQALLDAQQSIVAVYTQPDRPAGRGQKATPSPVKQLATAHQLPIYQPQSLRETSAQAELAALKPDLLLVVAYGLILPQAVLDIPRWGCINSHASLLPRWRGAAPIQRAIAAGDTDTGITLMLMEQGLDTGPMLQQLRTTITPQDTAQSLQERLAALGAAGLTALLPVLQQRLAQAQIQSESLVTYAHKLNKAQARLDWQQPAVVLERQVRAFYPWPGSHTSLSGIPIKVLEAHLCAKLSGVPGTILESTKHGLSVACANAALRITRLQLASGKPLDFAELLHSRAAQFAVGQMLQ